MLEYAPAGHSLHSVVPVVAFWNVPVGHAVHADSPTPVPYVPAGQLLHTSSPNLPPNMPAGHSRQTDSPAPAYAPNPHAPHWVAPAYPLNVPTEQFPQTLLPVLS